MVEPKEQRGPDLGRSLGVRVGKEQWVGFGTGRLVAPGHVAFEVARSDVESPGRVASLAWVESKGG
jgi:hypothetical protein